MAEKIQAMLVVEMMGRPPEHIKQTMEDLLNKLDEEKGVTVTRKTIHEPKEVKPEEGQKNAQEIFTTFSEVEIEVPELVDLAMVIFKYMPSHVEILSPTEMNLKNFDISALLSGISSKLHQYDAVAKNALMQNQILKAQFQKYIQEHPPKEKKAVKKASKTKKAKSKKTKKKK